MYQYPSLLYRIRRDLKTQALLLFMILSLFLGASLVRIQGQLERLQQQKEQVEKALAAATKRELTQSEKDQDLTQRRLEYWLEENVDTLGSLKDTIASQEAESFLELQLPPTDLASIYGADTPVDKEKQTARILETKDKEKRVWHYFIQNESWKKLSVPDTDCKILDVSTHVWAEESATIRQDNPGNFLVEFSCDFTGLYTFDGEQVPLTDPQGLLPQGYPYSWTSFARGFAGGSLIMADADQVSRKSIFVVAYGFSELPQYYAYFNGKTGILERVQRIGY